MKLKKYIKQLKHFAKNNPECLNMKVYIAIDDEGNGYDEVIFSPAKGIFKEGEFLLHPDDIEGKEINAVCVN